MIVPNFIYSNNSLEDLKLKDPKMSQLINYFGRIERTINPDLYASMIESIIAQQISRQAFNTIYNRVLNKLKQINIITVTKTDDQTFKECGLSTRKIDYIRSVTHFFIAEDMAELIIQSDDYIIKRLSSIKGVGIWTAQMMLIFSLNKQNIFAYDDSAIKKAIKLLYGEEKLTIKNQKVYHTLFSPYNTVACFYLWAFANSRLTLDDILQTKKDWVNDIKIVYSILLFLFFFLG